MVSKTLRTFGLTDSDDIAGLFLNDPLPTTARVAKHLRARAILLPPSITAEFLADRLLSELRIARPMPSEALEVSCWDIDQFRPFKNVPTEGLVLPLLEEEENIKKRFNSLLGEWRLHGDWGGELNDLFSAQCRLNGREVPAAFLLKGRSITHPLRIRDCGKGGDQLLRLTDSPATVLVVQHVHQITEPVRRQLRMNIEALRRRDVDAVCCFIDGTQTFQVLNGSQE